jgi:hypothetical protein
LVLSFDGITRRYGQRVGQRVGILWFTHIVVYMKPDEPDRPLLDGFLAQETEFKKPHSFVIRAAAGF